MATNDIPRALLDSCALLAVIKDEPGAERLDGLLGMVGQGKIQLVESVLVLGEVYKHSNAKDNSERARQDEKLRQIRTLLKSREVMLLDVTPPITEKATEFRREHGLKLPDAIHLATAVLNRCDWFVSLDNDFPDLSGLKTYRLAHLRDRSVQLPWDLASQDPLFVHQPNVVQLRSPRASREA